MDAFIITYKTFRGRQNLTLIKDVANTFIDSFDYSTQKDIAESILDG